VEVVCRERRSSSTVEKQHHKVRLPCLVLGTRRSSSRIQAPKAVGLLHARVQSSGRSAFDMDEMLSGIASNDIQVLARTSLRTSTESHRNLDNRVSLGIRRSSKSICARLNEPWTLPLTGSSRKWKKLRAARDRLRCTRRHIITLNVKFQMSGTTMSWLVSDQLNDSTRIMHAIV
jgi:hypothetical protein